MNLKEKKKLSAIFIIMLSVVFCTSCSGSLVSNSKDLKKEVKNSEQKEKSAPVINFYNTSYNFGAILQGATVKHSFAFKNEGNEKLIISKVAAG